MVLSVAGRSKDVEDHSGEASKPKVHKNQGEKGEIICTLNWLFIAMSMIIIRY